MKLYQCINKIGTYWVVANDPTEAQTKIEKRLNDGRYGYSEDRKLTEIRIVAEEITDDLNFGHLNKYLLL